MSAVLHRSDLDDAQCSGEGCDHTAHDDGVVLHAGCHMESPTWVSYQAKTGIATITCAECGAYVAEISVNP